MTLRQLPFFTVKQLSLHVRNCWSHRKGLCTHDMKFWFTVLFRFGAEEFKKTHWCSQGNLKNSRQIRRQLRTKTAVCETGQWCHFLVTFCTLQNPVTAAQLRNVNTRHGRTDKLKKKKVSTGEVSPHKYEAPTSMTCFRFSSNSH
jgi:hypothetical protein